MRFSWFLGVAACLAMRAIQAQQTSDRSRHIQRFVAVAPDVRIEVLDWGGVGRPLMIIPGQWVTAHSFDTFAAKLASEYHVYVLTRRGNGESSKPSTGYDAYRLGEDVLAVMDSLHVTRPILVGHSFGGEELSAIGSRFPERVAGLVYLDSALPYAFYDRAHLSFGVELADLKQKVDSLFLVSSGPLNPGAVARGRSIVDSLLASLPAFERALHEFRAAQPSASTVPDTAHLQPFPPEAAFSAQFNAGVRKFTSIRAPALAIYALPGRRPPDITSNPILSRLIDHQDSLSMIQSIAFERGVAGARVIRIPNADHAIYQSNESDVLREIRAFISTLPP